MRQTKNDWSQRQKQLLPLSEKINRIVAGVSTKIAELGLNIDVIFPNRFGGIFYHDTWCQAMKARFTAFAVNLKLAKSLTSKSTFKAQPFLMPYNI